MRIVFTRHAVQRMFERSITETEIEWAIGNGDVIDEYPEDKPYPSRLSLSVKNKKPLHVVYSVDKENDCCIVITVYEPSSNEWNEDNRTRRNKV